LNIYDKEAIEEKYNLKPEFDWINEVENYYLNKILKNFKVLNILDAGCGRGFKFKTIKKFTNNFIGIDYSFYPLLLAKNLNNNVIQASILNLPFKDNTFDLVFTFQVIGLCSNNFEDCFKAFKELVRVSRKYIMIGEYRLGGRINERYVPVIKDNKIVLNRFSFMVDDYISWANKLNLKIIKIGSYLNIKPKGIGKFPILKGIYKFIDYSLFKLGYKKGLYLFGLFEKINEIC